MSISQDVDLKKVRLIKFGKHASTTDISADAASPYFVDLDADATLAEIQEKVDRDNILHPENGVYSALNGIKSATLQNVVLEMRGLSTTAGNATAADYSSYTQVGEIFDCLFGAAGVNGTGDTTDASNAGSGTSVIMDATPGTPIATGGGMLVKGTSSGLYVARQVVSRSNETYTVDRALTDAEGSADTADESEVVYAGSTWILDQSNPNHVHAYFDAEGSNWRRKLHGCGPTQWAYQIPNNGGRHTLTTAWIATDWTDVAEANPTYSAQSAGSPIVGANYGFWIGSTQYHASDINLSVNISSQPLETPVGINGKAGYKVAQKIPTLSFMVPYSEALKAALEAEGTDDVAIQIGRTPGRCVYHRLPEFDAREVTRADKNGIEMLSVSGVGTLTPGNVGSYLMTIF